MDPESFESDLRNLRCTEETEVQYFDSREAAAGDSVLNEQELLSKIPSISGLLEHTPAQSSTTSDGHVPFILITANGDPNKFRLGTEKPLRISTTALKTLVTSGILSPFFISVHRQSRHHFSHRIEYDSDNVRPVALHVVSHVRDTKRSVYWTMRVRLHDLATVAFISSRDSNRTAYLRSRCIRQVGLLNSHPFHLVNFVLEDHVDSWRHIIRNARDDIYDNEKKTGLGAKWNRYEETESDEKLEQREYTGLLRDLQAINWDLRRMLLDLRFAAALWPVFGHMLQKLEGLRHDMGVGPLKPGVKAALEDQFDFNQSVSMATKEAMEELVDRAQAQISVTYSLIAQRDSERNIEIARLTAKDSKTTIQIAKLTAKDSQIMKTITVLTLTFLPSTMLASLWDAGIFTLDADKSWRIYVGTTCALTITVFALWYLYLWVSRTRSPVTIGDEEKQTNTEKGE